jgi:signal transduction histidine kinase
MAGKAMTLRGLMVAGLLAAATAPSYAAATADPHFDQLIDASKMAMMTDPQAAYDRADQALRLAKAAPDANTRATRTATAQWLEAEALIRTDRAKDALPIIAQALAAIQKDAPNSKLHGDLLMARGGAKSVLGQVQPALEDFLSAHRVFGAAGEARGQAKALQEIGSIYQDAGDYRRVLQYYDQSAEAYAADPSLLVSAYNNKANALKALNRFPEAIAQYRLALAQARVLESAALEAHILTNLASTEVAAGELARADADLARARILTNSEVADHERPFIDGVAAQAALKRGQYQRAAQLLEQTFVGVDPESTNPAYRDFHEAAYQTYSRLGDDRRALVHLRAFKRIDDATRSLAADTNAALMTARFDFANQDLKIARLKAGQLQRDVELARSRNLISTVLLAGAAAMLLLLAIGLVSIRRSRNAVRASNVKLNEANGSLQKALKAKTEFLATTSHEIRTPLNGILGMTQVLLADRQVGSDVRDKISIVHGAGEAMKALVDDLLDLAKMETGKASVSLAEMDLHDLLRQTAQLWKQPATSKGVELRLNIEEVPSRIVEDGARLKQILSNLMSNAIKFTDHGCVTLEALVEGGSGQEQLRLSVSDTGIGIASAQIEEAFESFKQLDGGLTRKHAGTGLGLTICRNLASALGGTIAVTSEVGVGSTFTLCLPLRRAPSAAPPLAAATTVPGTLADARLLIVEANPLAQSVMRALLQAKVAGLELVASAPQGLDALQTNAPDLVLVEISALGSDMTAQLTALKQLVLAARGAPVAALCSSPEPSLITALRDAGAAQVLCKPINGPTLLTRLETLVTTATVDPPAARRA